MENNKTIKREQYREDFRFYIRLYRYLVAKYGKRNKIVKKVYKYMKDAEKNYNNLLSSI